MQVMGASIGALSPPLLAYHPLLALFWGFVGAALLAWLLWPKRGLLAGWQRSRYATERVLAEDALKHICKLEIDGRRPSLASIAGILESNQNTAARVVEGLEAKRLIENQGGEMVLTAEGRRYAMDVIRAHRVWERHLAEQTGLTQSEWHGEAERYEHLLSPEQTNALAASLGYPTHDPHGDPIPTPDGEFMPHGGRPLSTIEPGTAVRIVHIEDEPDAVYAQIIAAGLYPGQILRVVESADHRMTFHAEAGEQHLAPVVATNVSVVPILRDSGEEAILGPGLDTLKLGVEGTVGAISPLCRGPERRRLLDLGILPGAKIKAEMRSPSGDPTAYRVRDSVIALRARQARLIHLQPVDTAA